MRTVFTAALLAIAAPALSQGFAGSYNLQATGVEARLVLNQPDNQGAFTGYIAGPSGLTRLSGRIQNGLPVGWVARKDDGGIMFLLVPSRDRKIHFCFAQFQLDGSLVQGSYKRLIFSVPEAPMVRINGANIENAELDRLEKRYRFRIPPGNYWYDRRSGAWGMQGGPTLGITQAGINIGGPMQRDASNGNSGVIVNGRDLHRLDIAGLQQAGIQPIPGRWWVNSNGDFGLEGSPFAVGNLLQVARASRPSGGSGYGSVYSGAAGGGVAFDGQGGFIASFRDNHGGFIGQHSGQ